MIALSRETQLDLFSFGVAVIAVPLLIVGLCASLAFWDWLVYFRRGELPPDRQGYW